jgi:pyridoxamine 5'-phosphate oxidase
MPEPTGDEDPIALFETWFDVANDAGIFMPEAMSVSTAAEDGQPSSRMILLKKVDHGFVFFTNYGSRKAREIEANPRVSLLFHWAILERQVRIEGPAARISTEESAAYFRTRGRGSRIGAWASRQSEPIAARGELEAKVREMKERFQGEEVPIPDFWGGYRVIPETIEFWQGRMDRLHDRWVWRRPAVDADWTVRRLQP